MPVVSCVRPCGPDVDLPLSPFIGTGERHEVLVVPSRFTTPSFTLSMDEPPVLPTTEALPHGLTTIQVCHAPPLTHNPISLTCQIGLPEADTLIALHWYVCTTHLSIFLPYPTTLSHLQGACREAVQPFDGLGSSLLGPWWGFSHGGVDGMDGVLGMY